LIFAFPVPQVLYLPLNLIRINMTSSPCLTHPISMKIQRKTKVIRNKQISRADATTRKYTSNLKRM